MYSYSCNNVHAKFHLCYTLGIYKRIFFLPKKREERPKKYIEK